MTTAPSQSLKRTNVRFITETAFAGAVRGLAEQVDVPTELLVAAEVGLEELAPSDDDREEVVEVVGDPAGELADGLHLLSLGELILGS